MHKQFKIEYKKPNDLIPYKLNAKTHPDSQLRLIKHSIDTFNMDQPIVIDDNNVIIKGHGRRLAAIELGYDTVPVIIRNDMTETEKRAARLADNKCAESPFDNDILKMELEELNVDFDVSSIGFDLSDFVMELPIENKVIDEDEMTKTENECPKCGFKW